MPAQATIASWTKTVDKTIAAGPFRADWPSLQNVPVPDWYINGKFGIFIHWGPYCVPAFENEWYPRNMYLKDQSAFQHHLANYGPQSQFGYKDFIPRFKAEHFDANAWAALFKRAGAKFVVPVAEHHDGFAMYKTALNRWNAAAMGPRRNILGELAAAVPRHQMIFGASSHRAEHWWFMEGGRTFDSDVSDPQFADLYGPARPRTDAPDAPRDALPDDAFLTDWLARTAELIDTYQPQLLWFDWWIKMSVFKPYLRRLAAFYYNRSTAWKKPVVLNYKEDAFPDGAAVLDIERGQLADIRAGFWQTDTSVSRNSWCYIRDHQYKSAGEIFHDLIDIVSKNGALLLNIGPKPDGTIPEPEQKILSQLGVWLGTYGQAIYGTRPWKVFGEGPTQIPTGGFTDKNPRPAFTERDFRFTTAGNTLYCICMAQPEKKLTIQSLATGSPLVTGKIQSVEMLANPEPLAWSREPRGLTIAPAKRKCSSPIRVFKVEFAG